MPTTHVTSLELSRRLDELGVKRGTHFYWRIHGRSLYSRKEVLVNVGIKKWELDDVVPAYLASELGELLPVRVNSGRRKYKVGGKPVWFCNYSYKGNKIHHNESADTLADAMALMLIWLLENHLISVEELGK